MAHCNFVIKDNTTGLFLTAYSTTLANCSWGNPEDAVCFETLQAAKDAITSWGETEEGRFIGQNPPVR